MKEELVELILTNEGSRETNNSGKVQSGNREGESSSASAVTGMIIGLISELNESGEPLVDFPINPDSRPIAARSTTVVTRLEIGREAVLMFEQGDLHRPIILGLLQIPGQTMGTSHGPAKEVKEVHIDGERLVLAAEKEIVLRCGEASITLTRAGKILIRGAYLLNKSSGVNRIKGGSVKIN